MATVLRGAADARQGRRDRGRRGLRNRGQRFLESLGERGTGGGALDTLLGRADSGRVHAVGRERELVRLEVDGAPDEEAGRHEQHERDRHLRADEPPHDRSQTPARGGARVVLEELVAVRPGREHRRRDPGRDRGHHRGDRDEREHGQVHAQVPPERQAFGRARRHCVSGGRRQRARSAPPTAPPNANTDTSIQNCMAIRARDAPSAVLTATSRDRAAAPASSTLVTFAQATRSTRSATLSIDSREEVRQAGGVEDVREHASTWTGVGAGSVAGRGRCSSSALSSAAAASSETPSRSIPKIPNASALPSGSASSAAESRRSGTGEAETFGHHADDLRRVCCSNGRRGRGPPDPRRTGCARCSALTRTTAGAPGAASDP